MSTHNLRHSIAAVAVLFSLGVANVASAEDGVLTSSGSIDQTVTISKSIEMVQGAAASRQAVNLVAGRSVDVADVLQKVEADELQMGQIALGSSQAVNAVVADSPEGVAAAALADVASAASAIGKIGKLFSKGR
jgi:hypothetical protein